MFRSKTKPQTLQDKAQEVAAQLRRQAKDAKLDARAAELAERAAEVAERLKATEAYRSAQARSSELAGKTREKIRETHIDERAAELADKVRDTAAAERAREATERTLERVGGWLAEGRTGERLHLPHKRGVSGWVAAAFGLVAGYAIGLLAAPKRGEEMRRELASKGQELASKGQELATKAQAKAQELRAGAGGVDLPTTGPGAQTLQPPQAVDQKPLADKVRTALGQDPRTADLPKLNINVVESTVFVRGVVPEGVDQQHIRSVVQGVEGVSDVDLQVTTGT